MAIPLAAGGVPCVVSFLHTSSTTYTHRPRELRIQTITRLCALVEIPQSWRRVQHESCNSKNRGLTRCWPERFSRSYGRARRWLESTTPRLRISSDDLMPTPWYWGTMSISMAASLRNWKTGSTMEITRHTQVCIIALAFTETGHKSSLKMILYQVAFTYIVFSLF